MLRKINILLNPFDVVRYNSDDQPDSRSLHTSFWEKMVDTYRVFRGESHADNVRAAEIRIRTNMMAKVMSEHITIEAFERLCQL